MIMTRPLAAFAVALIAIAPAAAGELIDVAAVRLDLSREDPAETALGRLAWRGSVALRSPDPRFGGLSDFLLSPDGRSLTAISDEGHWLSARIMLDGTGVLTGLAEVRMGALLDPEGRPLVGKETGDAESMVRLPDGSILVGFERRHRIWRYPSQAEPLTGLPEVFPPPPRLERLSENSGLEALAILPTGRLVALTEDGGSSPEMLGFLRQNETWHEIVLARVGPFRPTGATTLPGGDLLVLERRFSILGGLGIRIRRIDQAKVQPDALLEGEAVAEFRPPFIYDNMEGIGVHSEADGRIRLYLLSDDNKNPAQRTILKSFLLMDDAE